MQHEINKLRALERLGVVDSAVEAWIDKLVEDYRVVQESYDHQFLRVSFWDQEDQFYKLKNKYTVQYANWVYARLRPLRNYQLISFYTFTIRNTPGWGNYCKVHIKSSTCENSENCKYQVNLWDNVKIRLGWKSLRSIMSRNGIKNPTYLKVYELTKRNRIHIHVAFFDTFTHEQHQAIFRYWNKNYGFCQAVYHSDFTSEIHPHKGLVEGKDYITYCKQYQYFYNVSQDVLEAYLVKDKKRIDGAVTGYVMKYQVKLPSLRQQAFIKYLRLRTYEMSKNLSKYLKFFRDTWVAENPIGEIRAVSILYMDQKKEVETSGMHLEKWQFDPDLPLSEMEAKKNAFGRALRAKFFNFELELNLHDFDTISFCSTLYVEGSYIRVDPMVSTRVCDGGFPRHSDNPNGL